MKKKISKKNLQIIGVASGTFGKTRSIISIAVIQVIPLFLFFLTVEDDNLRNDYRYILNSAFGIDFDTLNNLPERPSLPIPTLIVELFLLQLSILSILAIFYLAILLFKTVFRRKFLYIAALTARFLKNLIFNTVNMRALMFKEIRPYAFFTEVEINTRTNRAVFRRAFWITMVIFAASFQFAGLIYIRSNSFPEIFQIGGSVIDTSVVFMIISGVFWMTFLIGIDILERYDVRILDLGRSKLMNIGVELGKISKNAFNFLTLSFFIIAVQDFKSDDWVQTIIFLDIFLLISTWILLDYESHLFDVGSFIRHGLDRRTISGAERFVINKEKKRFGERKLKEAEAMMVESEKRVDIAHQIGFANTTTESILTIWIVLITSSVIIFLISFTLGTITVNALLVIQTLSALVTMSVLWFSQGLVSRADTVRRELIWFPLAIIGNVIVTYVYFEYGFHSVTFNIYTIASFLILWFFLIIRNVYPKLPGFEFWGSTKTFFFALILFIVMISTWAYQIALLTYFDMI